MRQTTLSVALEVKPESYEHLSSLLDQLRARPSLTTPGWTGPFDELKRNVPVLHFMAFSLFAGHDYDPLFVIEANFDGEAGPFWAQLEATLGAELRDCLRCCKPPLDSTAPLYDAVTEDDTRAPIAPYLEARSLTPTAFHHGNRGLPRDRILQEFELFKKTRVEIANNDAAYRQLDAVEIHSRLRAALIGSFPWLNQPAPPRISWWESISDYIKLIAFGIAAIFALTAPGLVLAAVMPPVWYFALMGVLFLIFSGWLIWIAPPLPGTKTQSRFNLGQFAILQLPGILIFLILYFATVTLLEAPLSKLFANAELELVLARIVFGLGLALAGAAVTVAGILVWLRTLERADSSQDAPPVNPHFLREMARREDWIPQNHMGSVVLVKPGILRAILIRAGHLGLGLLLRVTARAGYLGSMRTIHFAHWALVNNKSRLMFFSNFDQTWESYLDDFIEKAHVGLTLAWTCSVGFPTTRFLVFEGASYGRQFKEWARHSMAVSHLWYSAYPDLTTEQVERNYRIALDLRKPSLTLEEAKKWINDL